MSYLLNLSVNRLSYPSRFLGVARALSGSAVRQNKSSSKPPSLHQLPIEERIQYVQAIAGAFQVAVDLSRLDKISENVVGMTVNPLSVIMGVLINGKLFNIPASTEEPSVIAGMAGACKIVGLNGGFVVTPAVPLMQCQVQMISRPNLTVDDVERRVLLIKKHSAELVETANSRFPNMKARGGGVLSVDMTVLPPLKPGENWMFSVNFLNNVCDAQGANHVNRVAASMAPDIKTLLGDEIGMCILSNSGALRVAKASVSIAPETLVTKGISGFEMVDRIVWGAQFALRDPMRAITHNKGVLNGALAVVQAFDEDTRAFCVAVMDFCKDHPLATWKKAGSGHLVGEIEMPVVAGLIGNRLPHAEFSKRLSKVGGAQDLSMIIVTAGLASNLAALRSLMGTGILANHMGFVDRRM